MQSPPPPFSVEAFEASLDAECRLASLELFEDLALLCEEEQRESLRERFAEQYRSTVGVYPDLRHRYREGLERIRAGSGMPCANLIELIRLRYASGFSPLPSPSPLHSGSAVNRSGDD